LSQQLSIPLAIGTANAPAVDDTRGDDFRLLAPVSGERYLAAAALAGSAGALMMTTESARTTCGWPFCISSFIMSRSSFVPFTRTTQ
jgi:hypothetical protein